MNEFFAWVPLGAHIWTLEIATHMGGWDRTPFRGQIEQLVDVIQSDFPWVVEAIP